MDREAYSGTKGALQGNIEEGDLLLQKGKGKEERVLNFS